MEIKILGTGCANCKKLEKNVKIAINNLNIEGQIIKVEDIKEIMSYGVLGTPALVVNDEIKSYGKVLSPSQIEKILK